MSLTTIRAGEDWVGDPPAPSVPRRPLRVWNADAHQWVAHIPKRWDGTNWVRPVGDYTTTTRSAFHPYIGEGTVWTRDVSDMPLATKSADYAAWMAANINYTPGGGFGPTTMNTSSAGTHPIQCYVVDSREPGTNYQYITGTAPGSFPGGLTGYTAAILTGWVPWPSWAFVPQAGQDSGLAIFDIGTGILREYYLVTRVAGHSNKWTCTTGGWSLANPDLAGWATDNYATHLTMGTNSVVGMHNCLGFVGISEAMAGRINHALAFTFSNGAMLSTPAESIDANGVRTTIAGPSWPAKGGDADTPGDVSPIHGQWGRLPASLDPTPYKPFTRLLIRAAQEYGIVGTDTNNFVHAFNAEPGFMHQHFFNVDPWRMGGDVYDKYSAVCQQEGRLATDALSVSDFPWALTEWAPRNWGKPE